MCDLWRLSGARALSRNHARALLDKEVDVAIVCGPLAGYWQRKSDKPLRISPVMPLIDGPRSPMAFDLNMGVRKDDVALCDDLNSLVVDASGTLNAILAGCGLSTLGRGTLKT